MTFPRHMVLRAKTMFLIHGLIPCLGEGLLRGLSLTTLLVLVQEGDGKDLMEVNRRLSVDTGEWDMWEGRLAERPDSRARGQSIVFVPCVCAVCLCV